MMFNFNICLIGKCWKSCMAERFWPNMH
jgi:hypothetical protein